MSQQASKAKLGGVLLAGNFLSGLGLARAPIEDLAERLAARGYTVVSASRIRAKLPRAADLLLTAWSRRRDYEAAVVDIYSGNAFYWGAALTLLLRALGRESVLCLHGGGLPDFAKRHPRRIRACLRRARFVIAPSAYLVEQMRPYRADIEELPNPLDVADYEFRERNRPEARLVWLRTFRSIYNPTLAPKVLAELGRRGIDAHLTMYGADSGDGSLEATRETARQLGVTTRLTIAGSIPKREVPEALGRADIFLNTTNVDNTPVSVVEAMAKGLCVVTTDVGGLPYLLEHGRDALLAPAGDAGALADAVQRLLAEPLLGGSLSRQARDKALRFDWAPVLDRWVALLGRCSIGPSARVDGRALEAESV